jgi:hypothetical protein
MDFHKGNFYKLVTDYCEAFELPVNKGDPIRIKMRERISYSRTMIENIFGFAKATDSEQDKQVLAIIYFMYDVLVAFAYIGHDPYNDARLRNEAEYGRQLATDGYDEYGLPPAADRLLMGMPQQWRIESANRAASQVFDFLQLATRTEQVVALHRLYDWALVSMAQIGAGPIGYFHLVHDSFMANLWPDGKARYNADGTIRHPEGWTTPLEELQTYAVDMMREQDDTDEIPF